MLPQRFTKSVTITATDSNYTIIALCISNKEGEEDWEKVELEEGKSHTFEQKTEDLGGWHSVRKILSIKLVTI